MVAKKRKPHNYDPTPKQIEREAAKIRKGWAKKAISKRTERNCGLEHNTKVYKCHIMLDD
jgi:hypothetical protein